MPWRWNYGWDRDPMGSADFPSQSDAEAWLGEHWRRLLDDGVPAVTLMEDGRAVYGPMNLAPE